MEGRGVEGRWVGRSSGDKRPRDELDNEPGPSTKRAKQQDSEDIIDLLDESEVLELVEFDPKVRPTDTWDPPQSMLNFLEKYFNKALTEDHKERLPKTKLWVRGYTQAGRPTKGSDQEQGEGPPLRGREIPLQDSGSSSGCGRPPHLSMG